MQNWAAPDFSASDWYLPKAKQKQIYFEKKNNIGFFPASSCQKKGDTTIRSKFFGNL